MLTDILINITRGTTDKTNRNPRPYGHVQPEDS